MARVVLLWLSFLSVKAHQTCTKGRLFVADKDASKVHVLDLDDADGVVVASLDAPIAGARLMATDTDMATVIAIDRGSSAQGSVHFYSPGLSADDHGDHVDVVKSTPRAHDYTLTGWKPTHTTYSAGYVNVFMDGVWSSDLSEDMHNSSAVFVKESSLSTTPVVVEVPIDGAHHGVSYALSDNHFVMSVSTDARKMRVDGTSSLPGSFAVASAAGAVLQEIGTESSPSCPAFHGAAKIGNTFVTGCGSGGWLRGTYTGQASEPVSWERVEFPKPNASLEYRSGTVRKYTPGSLFLADLYPLGLSAPRYVAPISPTGSVAAGSLLEVTRSTSENDVCHWAVDQAVADDGTHVAVLTKDGSLSVAEVDGNAAGTMAVASVFDNAIDCADTAMVAGHGVVHIVAGGVSPRLLTVDLAEVLGGHADHAVSSTSLSFTPASRAALALPSSMACAPEGHGHGHDHDHDHDDETSSTSMLTATLALLLGAMLWVG